jgi:hypothetical protein
MYEEFTKIKKKNQQIKALLSLGGASAGVDKFRKLAESKDDRFVEAYYSPNNENQISFAIGLF